MKTYPVVRRPQPTSATRSPAFGVAASAAMGLLSQNGWAHEGHGGFGELHAHGDTLWGLAALAVVVIVGWAWGKRK